MLAESPEHLAGSLLTFDQAWRNIFKLDLAIPLNELVKITAFNQAEEIGMADKIGRIAPGYQADIAIFSGDWKLLGVVESGIMNDLTSCNKA